MALSGLIGIHRHENPNYFDFFLSLNVLTLRLMLNSRNVLLVKQSRKKFEQSLQHLKDLNSLAGYLCKTSNQITSNPRQIAENRTSD